MKLDSDLRVDRCGVCGGSAKDISDCAAAGSSAASFAWEEAPLSQCSAPCGGGYMMAHAVCRNNATGARVHEELCDNSRRPQARMAPCNNRPCPPR